MDPSIIFYKKICKRSLVCGYTLHGVAESCGQKLCVARKLQEGNAVTDDGVARSVGVARKKSVCGKRKIMAKAEEKYTVVLNIWRRDILVWKHCEEIFHMNFSPR